MTKTTKKKRLKSAKEKNIKNWFSIKKSVKKEVFFCFFLNIKMGKKTLKFNNIRLNKKEFHQPEEPIDLLSVIVDQLVVCDKFKHNNEGLKYFIGYLEGRNVKPLCIVLP